MPDDYSVMSSSVVELKATLSDFCPSLVTEDKFSWEINPTKIFSIPSCYDQLLLMSDCSAVLETSLVEAVSEVWRNEIAQKIKLFGWRLFLNILPSRDQFNRRGILVNSHDLPCVFCFLGG